MDHDKFHPIGEKLRLHGTKNFKIARPNVVPKLKNVSFAYINRLTCEFRLRYPEVALSHTKFCQPLGQPSYDHVGIVYIFSCIVDHKGVSIELEAAQLKEGVKQRRVYRHHRDIVFTRTLK